jgi:hypothetical protein
MTPMLGIMASGISGNLWAPGKDYDSIATVTVGSGGSSSIAFTSIPSTYRHLQIRGIAKTSNLGWVEVKFNGDTASNYSFHEIRGDGSAASASNSINAGSMSSFLQNASQVASGVIDVLDYANVSKNKTIRTLGGYDDNGAGYITLTSGLWRNTNAITSITITHSSSTFTQYTQFALYGVK